MDILNKRLILVTGKGGVGRSTVAASIALACAQKGRRTLLFECNAKDRFGSFFGQPPVRTQVTRLQNNLYAINTNPEAALEEYGLMILRFKRVYKMVFENRITKYFLRAIPGLDEYSILGKAWFHTTEEKRGRPTWDTLVFDMPASGHSLSMLRVPFVIDKTVPDGPLRRDAKKLIRLLQDSTQTALTMVTLAEEMPANEAKELAQSFKDEMNLSLQQLFINQVFPAHIPDNSPQSEILSHLVTNENKFMGFFANSSEENDKQLENDPLTAICTHAELSRRRRQLNEHYLERIKNTISCSQIVLPRLFVPTISQSEVETLSKIIAKVQPI